MGAEAGEREAAPPPPPPTSSADAAARDPVSPLGPRGEGASGRRAAVVIKSGTDEKPRTGAGAEVTSRDTGTVHPELEELIMVDADSSTPLERIVPNGDPVRVDNELFEGLFLAMFRTSESDFDAGESNSSSDSNDDSGEASPRSAISARSDGEEDGEDEGEESGPESPVDDGERPPPQSTPAPMSTPTPATADKRSGYFRDKRRRFEFQWQLRLKKIPPGKLFMSVDLEDPVRLGVVQRAFVSACLNFVQKRNGGFHYSLGHPHENAPDEESLLAGRYERSHVAFAVDRSMDRLAVTKPGDPLPVLGEEIYEDPESIERRRRGGPGRGAEPEDVVWNTDDTYTMGLWSEYADFAAWECVNFPGVRPFSMSGVVGPQFVTLSLYCLKPEVKVEEESNGADAAVKEKEEANGWGQRRWTMRRRGSGEMSWQERKRVSNANNGFRPHNICDKMVYSRMEISHRRMTSMGPLARQLLASGKLRAEAEPPESINDAESVEEQTEHGGATDPPTVNDAESAEEQTEHGGATDPPTDGQAKAGNDGANIAAAEEIASRIGSIERLGEGTTKADNEEDRDRGNGDDEVDAEGAPALLPETNAAKADAARALVGTDGGGRG